MTSCLSARSRVVIAVAFLSGCGTPSAPNPFAEDAGILFDGGPTGAGGGARAPRPRGAPRGGAGRPPPPGAPMLACTLDHCDLEIERCRFSPDDAACQNELYCDGVEVCDNKLGCRAGEPVSCSDTSVCTIDACDEATDACSHAPRDADLDGDPDVHCPGGGDCDDADPTIASTHAEVCANLKDDDCDGVVDEADCSAPQHDTCLDALLISASGSYAMDTTAAAFDYATSCGLPNQAALRDVVAAVMLPAGPPVDVEVTARSPFPDVAVTLAGQCGDAATEIACGLPFPSTQGGKLAKLRGRALGSPSQETALPLYVTTDQGTPLVVDVQILPPEPAPTNETCGTAAPIAPAVPVVAPLVGTVVDLASACPSATGDLVYELTLGATQNVDVYATSVDGDGVPSISLRGAGCALPEDELTCQTSASAHVFRQSLPPGTYWVRAAATAPTDALVTVELSAPTPAPPDDDCTGVVALPPNETIDVALAGHQDDINLGCFPGAADAAMVLDVPVASDVLLVERIAAGDAGAIELSQPACAGPQDLVTCGTGVQSPVRAAKHNVPAGQYRVVAESTQAQAVKVTAFVRPAVAPVLVPFADGCADVFTIPPTGGLFQGSTANASANYNAGCDLGGVPQGGAKEQLLKLDLVVPKRVVLDMAGSGYTTLLDVREGPACPGQEVPSGCAVGYAPYRSYLDLLLGAGTYYLQIDGFNQESGPWFLDVRVVDP